MAGKMVIHGWLDPKGIIHPCGFGDHFQQAIEHLGPGVCANDWDPFAESASELLEQTGWIKIQHSEALEPDHVCVGAEWYVTSKQKEFIELHTKSHLCDLRIK